MNHRDTAEKNATWWLKLMSEMVENFAVPSGRIVPDIMILLNSAYLFPVDLF